MKRSASNIQDGDGNKSKKQRPKGPRPAAPAFTDHTASVIAATFAARRLPELKQLYEAREAPSLLDTRGFQSGGGKASSRHLRRRVTSFRRRQRHRYPTGGGRNSGRTATTSSHVPENEGDTKTSKPPSRRKRRKNKTLLQEKHSQWRLSTLEHDPVVDEATQPCVVHWIPTHIWHAKRFRMHDLWGWQVPLLHTNRGTKAAVRLVSKDQKCLVQDVTWRAQPVWCRTTHAGLPTLQQALRRVLADFDVSLASDGNVAVTYGSTMLHEMDRHPLGAIGPVSYLLQSTPLVKTNSGDVEKEGVFLYVWVHPSIRLDLWKQIHGVLCQLSSIQELRNGTDGGLSCLQLRGKNTMECLQKSLADSSTAETVRNATRDIGPTKIGSFTLDRPALLCIFTRPRDPGSPCNYGVCGLDIFGSPDCIQELFLGLILRGGACPIGLIEEEAIRLETQPPMTSFPRDFPDTEQGVAYWKHEETRDWTLLREYDYGSTGRVRNSTLSFLSIIWTDVVPFDAERVVFVRGPFLKPFLEALGNLGRSVPDVMGKEGTACKKIRRKVTNPRTLIRVPKPPTEKRATHVSYCESLAQSLSLPAALLCHIAIEGPGTIRSGTPLYRYKRIGSSCGGEELLGYAVTGSFSPSRGRTHGKAVVGASALLLAVGQAFEDNAAATERRNQRPLLLVRVGEEKKVGSLSIVV